MEPTTAKTSTSARADAECSFPRTTGRVIGKKCVVRGFSFGRPGHRSSGRASTLQAIRQVFGNDVPVQRCTQHKQRKVLDHLPERHREPVKLRLRRAWQETDHDRALEQLNRLAIELDHAHPGAAASLREGMEETMTVTRLGITGKLKLTLQSTNPCESMIFPVRVIHRNVKNWSLGDMCVRWTAAGMLEAESRFRKVQGYRGLANLAVAIEHDLLHRRQQAGHAMIEEEAAAPNHVTIQPGTAVTVNFHDERGNLRPGRQLH